MSAEKRQSKTKNSTRLVVTMPTATAVEFQTLCDNANISQQAWIRNIINRSIVVNRGGIIPDPDFPERDMSPDEP